MHSVKAIHSTARAGVTLIEVLVAIAIIGILVAISLPAISAARELSRKVGCGGQLRDIAIACENYTLVAGVFPRLTWKAQLLPYLGVVVAENDDQGDSTVYACPSDREHANGDNVHFSYAMNDGFGVGYHNGIWSNDWQKLVSRGEVVDGESNTAAFSERLSLPWFAPTVVDWNDFPHLYDRAFLRVLDDHLDLDAYYQQCHHDAGDPVMHWYITKAYQHVMPPNDNSCMLFPSQQDPAPRVHQVITAGSLHRGGTHTVFLDGHLKFVSENIDVSIWRALGTRNGGEPEASQEF